MVSNSGYYLDGFHSAIRGDSSLRRFEDPAANLVYKQGQPNFGLGDKTTRKIISHSFEESKRQENNAIQDRLLSRREGARHQAAQELNQCIQMRRSQEEREQTERRLQHYQDTLAGNLHQIPAFQTSRDFPLYPKLAQSCGGSGGGHYRDPQDMLRARSLNSHLDIGSCVPFVDPPPPVDPLVEQARQQDLRRQQELKELELQLLRQYPHGVPKRIQMEMLQKGLVLSGLGFSP